jgi:hypothetical protein
MKGNWNITQVKVEGLYVRYEVFTANKYANISGEQPCHRSPIASHGNFQFQSP